MSVTSKLKLILDISLLYAKDTADQILSFNEKGLDYLAKEIENQFCKI